MTRSTVRCAAVAVRSSAGSRTEVFRRVLCDVVGEAEERGQMPMPEAVDLVKAIAYERPKALFFGG